MSRRTGWIALGATFVAMAGVYLWGDALPQAPHLFPDHHIAAGNTGVIDDNELTLEGVRTTVGEGSPAGTRTLLVDFSVVPGPEAGICFAPELTEVGGAGRTWEAAGDIPGWDRWEGGELCGSDDGPGRATVGFLIPDDVRGRMILAVDASTLTEDPLWFTLTVD